MESSDLLSFAFIGTLAVCWQQVKAALDRLRSLVVVKITLSGQIADITTAYIHAKGRPLGWGDQHVRSTSEWVRPRRQVMEVAYETPSLQPRIVKIDGAWVSYHTVACGRDIEIAADQILVISALRWTVSFKKLVWHASEWNANRRNSKRGRFQINVVSGRPSSQTGASGGQGTLNNDAPKPLSGTLERHYWHWERDDIGAERPADPFASMTLSPEGQAALTDFRRWREQREWYEKKGLPWTRGHLYYGDPGGGKTSLARALAQDGDMPLWLFDLSTLDNYRFNLAWTAMQETAPCMAVFEEVDAVFVGRKNVRAETCPDALTFDCYLAAMGGMQVAHGVFKVVTTNKPDSLDAALCCVENDTDETSRPGRVDRKFKIGLATEEQRRGIIQHIVESCSEEDLRVTDGMSVAKVTHWAVEKVKATMYA